MSRELWNYGSVEFGEKLVLGFQGGDTESWKPGYYSVIDPTTGLFLIEEEPLIQYETSPPDTDLFFVEIDTLRTDTTTTGDLFAPRKHYLLVIHEDVTDPDPRDANQLRGFFYVATSVHKMLQRILGLLGENQVLDSFGYDQAGNITNLRMRVFDNSTDAENATDGATGPETGEVAQYDIVQDHQLPRSLRSFHRSYLTYTEDARE